MYNFKVQTIFQFDNLLMKIPLFFRDNWQHPQHLQVLRIIYQESPVYRKQFMEPVNFILRLPVIDKKIRDTIPW
jgi:hypothetical protein